MHFKYETRKTAAAFVRACGKGLEGGGEGEEKGKGDVCVDVCVGMCPYIG